MQSAPQPAAPRGVALELTLHNPDQPASLVDLPPTPADRGLNFVKLAFLSGEVDDPESRQQLRLTDCGVSRLDLFELLLLKRTWGLNAVDGRVRSGQTQTPGKGFSAGWAQLGLTD